MNIEATVSSVTLRLSNLLFFAFVRQVPPSAFISYQSIRHGLRVEI